MPDGQPAHYSTGRLTRAQADLVGAWRRRLQDDRPLPGRRPASPARRRRGLDDRPRASGSDLIAAAVEEVLHRGQLDPLQVARYAAAAQAAQEREDPDAPVHAPVSFYLPPELAAPYEALRIAARRRVRERRAELEAEARERFPSPGRDLVRERARWLAGALAAERLPAQDRGVPRGAVARMAIDRWSGRSSDEVAAAAEAYSLTVHGQPHRARRDMRHHR
jgi:hypothetical protein